ncbi:hypothetical protein AB0O20_06595 [Streptomyces kronopolitis]|uniref:hypothetical protein n=1 Tax=Streptomyces kronopolitis TaxID=1612435 RepID=UPI00341C52B4
MHPMHCPGYEPQPARPASSDVADMYKKMRVAEFDRLRELMADAIHDDALRPQGERVGIINAILAIRQLQRTFEERDSLRGNARYWIDYACAYAEGEKRAEVERDEARAELEQLHNRATYLKERGIQLRQELATAQAAHKAADRQSSRVEAERDEACAAIARVRALHQPVQHLGQTWCSECSHRRSTGPKTDEWVVYIPHPCPTLDAIEETQ